MRKQVEKAGRKCVLRWGKVTLTLLTGAVIGLSACSQSVSTSGEKSVTILGQFSPEETARFEESLLPFEEETGIDVVYESADNFTSLLKMRISSFNAPDLAVLPQPGLMADLARADLLVPLTDVMDTQALRASYSDDWQALGSVDGALYGLWYRVSVKSLVWYRPTAFEAKGYDIPQTWGELSALSKEIVADGGTPWCIGLESGAASGWPGTDWVEDILLRSSGPESYSQWISHELPFNSPPVIDAFNQFGQVLRNPKYVEGGAAKAVATPYGEAATGILSNPPDCYLHRQANFASSYFPEDKRPRVDYDVFPLPGIKEEFGTPILVAGDAIVLLNETPEAIALINYLATPEPHEIWASLGGFISPHQQVPISTYSDLVDQNIAQILIDAETIRFDASDMMPGAVGTGSFWTGMMEFAKGRPAEAVAKDIDETWP